ncbi:MAG: tryptophan-rich sensory protein [Actinobacteria bacterium]|nr:tryptophan-rich sensory protein [Actinomycetota bacterium]
MSGVTTGRVAAAAVSIALVVVYAGGSGRWVSQGDRWYRSLERPPWQPPDVVFGLAWPYNFTMLAVVGVVVASSADGRGRAVWLAAFTLSVVAALGWARLFYVSHALWPAAGSLAVAALATVPMLVVAWRTRPWAGIVLVPYLLWLCIATSLAGGYAARNPT